MAYGARSVSFLPYSPSWGGGPTGEAVFEKNKLLRKNPSKTVMVGLGRTGLGPVRAGFREIALFETPYKTTKTFSRLKLAALLSASLATISRRSKIVIIINFRLRNRLKPISSKSHHWGSHY